MAKAKNTTDMSNMCYGGACAKCYSSKLLVLGIIVLVNAYWPFARWDVLIGILLVVAGLIKWTMPNCPHCR